MVKFKQALTSVAAAAVLCAGLAAAQGIPGLGGPAPAPATGSVQVQMLTNGEDGYSIGAPIGWHVVTGQGADYAFIAPDGSAICVADAGDVPLDASEADIKAALSNDLGQQFWDGNLFGEVPNKKYVKTGANTSHPSGWPFQVAEVTATLDGQERSLAAMMTFKPKKIYVMLCNSASPSYEANKPAFNAVFESVRFSK